MQFLKIKNFKCFKDITIPLNNLTVFAGANANGKSSAIQALLFLRRTVEHCALWNEDKDDTVYHFEQSNGLSVELNGAYGLSLGSSSDVISNYSDEQLILFEIDNDGNKLKVEYEIPATNELYLTPKLIKNELQNEFYLFKQEFYYLCAERLGPRANNPIRFYDFPHVGYDGSLCAQLIGNSNFEYGFKVTQSRVFPESKNLKLGSQVNAWLNYILPDNEIEGFYDTKLMSSQIRMKNKFTQGQSVLATNIGFGISYVLPIILTALIAKEGSLFIVENPEAHLHPSAQSRLGRFLTIMSGTKINVLIETHSDHILTGMQLEIAKKAIDSKSVTINYFSKPETSDQPVVESIEINTSGELSKWPQGFFDQSQSDYAELLKIRKKDG
jgi:predicted ATPase